MKGLLGKFYSMHGHTIDDYLRKEHVKKLIWKRYWPAMVFSSSPGTLLLLSHQRNLSRLATYSAYLAANEAMRNKLKGQLAYENE